MCYPALAGGTLRGRPTPRFRTIQVCPKDLASALRQADDAVIPEGGTSHVRCGTAGVRGTARRRGCLAACGARAADGADAAHRREARREACPTPSNDPRNSRTKTPERATVVWHGKSLWCRHCFASQISAAEAETAKNGVRPTGVPFSQHSFEMITNVCLKMHLSGSRKSAAF